MTHVWIFPEYYQIKGYKHPVLSSFVQNLIETYFFAKFDYRKDRAAVIKSHQLKGYSSSTVHLSTETTLNAVEIHLTNVSLDNLGSCDGLRASVD